MSDDLPASLLLGSNLVSFLPGVNGEHQKDILNALLWAELNASDRCNQQKQWLQWMDIYSAELTRCGFRPHGTLSHKPVKVGNKSGFQRESARLLQSIKPDQLAAAAKSALDDMFNSDHARVFFHSWFNFNSGRSDSFQIVPCRPTTAGEVNLSACGLLMTTRTVPKLSFDIIRWPFAYEMALTLKGGGFVYNSDAYAPHRERVREALLKKSAEKIRRIALDQK